MTHHIGEPILKIRLIKKINILSRCKVRKNDMKNKQKMYKSPWRCQTRTSCLNLKTVKSDCPSTPVTNSFVPSPVGGTMVASITPTNMNELGCPTMRQLMLFNPNVENPAANPKKHFCLSADFNEPPDTRVMYIWGSANTFFSLQDLYNKIDNNEMFVIDSDGKTYGFLRKDALVSLYTPYNFTPYRPPAYFPNSDPSRVCGRFDRPQGSTPESVCPNICAKVNLQWDSSSDQTQCLCCDIVSSYKPYCSF